MPSSLSADTSDALLNTIKEEIFALESERLMDTLSETKYKEMKAGLDAVLKRKLNNRR